MLRGYTRQIRLWPAHRQEALLLSAGVAERVIYRDDQWKAAVKSLRPGDKLVVGGGLRVLGDNREDITACVKQVRARGASIMDAETGRTATDDGAELMSEAIARLRGERAMPTAERARAMQEVSAKMRRKNKRATRLDKREALLIWRNPKYTVPEALQLMPGWSAAAAYRELKARGIPAGPRGKN